MRFLTIPFLLCLLFACGEREDHLLLGEWEATQVLEAGDSLKLDPTQVGFLFRPDNRYTFRSTLRYEEAGTWHYAEGFLMAQDTTRNDSPERVVAIEKLTHDSLRIRMLTEGKERWVTLLKQK
ncbi:hypothetical protein FUA23_21305 [Neolewinella aurantiaca]|uniref:Lipocalin-like domain-containing protein n=1 Tax=Neolewinella aurantiaca TaxID=2602767 RepID=A0A5C7F5T4_9BACT|nr:hypothetical protein [Neolewinella aurantiaca]TXF84252.1 hypothetical protein FUA23_21305 [Neolewinella aurantiaca]